MPWKKLHRFLMVLGTVGVGWCCSVSAAIAAETVVIRLGPIEQSVDIDELESFAKTGTVPPGLRLFSPVLTKEVQYTLTNRIYLNGEISDHLVDDLLTSSSGKQILELLDIAAPKHTPGQFERALKDAAHHPDGMSLLGFLRAFPEQTLTIDASSAVALASQFNLPHWQSHALNSVLERELTSEISPSIPFYATFDPTISGYETVRQQTLTFRDRTRDRSIPVDLYWSQWTTGPLVIISHGFGADRRFLNYLASHLASHGLTVASLEHPGSNVSWLAGITLGESGTGGLSDIIPATEFVDRPYDVSFLLDELKRLDQYSAVLGDKFNTDNVLVIGHSLGGYTALALAGAKLDLNALGDFCDGRSLMELSPADWLQCNAVDLDPMDYKLSDQRIKQVIAISPVMGRIFNSESLSNIDVPTIITSASQDSITPSVHQQLLPFKAFASGNVPVRHKLVVAIGATHLSLGDPENLNSALTQSIFLRERRWEDTKSMRRMMRGLTLAFAKQQTPEADLYKPFLSAHYVESWSTDAVQLRLNTHISESLENWLQIATVPFERVVSVTVPKNSKKANEPMYTAQIQQAMKVLPLVLLIPPSQLSLSVLLYLRRNSRRRREKIKLW